MARQMKDTGLDPAAAGRDVFRYQKAGRTRAYRLRAVSDEIEELWVVSYQRGNAGKARRLVTFECLDDTAPFLLDVERELRAGGWARS